MQKAIKMSLKGKTLGSGQMDRIIMILKKEIDPWGYSDPALGLCTCVYDHYSRTNLLVYTSQT